MFVASRRIDWCATWPISIITWLWPEVKFWPWPFEVNSYIFRIVSTERNTMMPLPILYLYRFKSYSWKNISPVTAICTIFDLWRLNRWPEVTFDVVLTKRRFQKLSAGIICVFLAITVSDIMTRFLKNIVASIELWPLMTSGDPNIALRGKLPEILSNVSIESYRMLFYRIFLALLVF